MRPLVRPDEADVEMALHLRVITGPKREDELNAAIVDGLTAFRRPDGSYRLSNEYQYLITDA